MGGVEWVCSGGVRGRMWGQWECTCVAFDMRLTQLDGAKWSELRRQSSLCKGYYYLTEQHCTEALKDIHSCLTTVMHQDACQQESSRSALIHHAQVHADLLAESL